MPTFLYNIYPILPEIYMVIGACILLMYGVLTTTSHERGYPLLNVNLGWLFLQIIIISFLIVLSTSPLNILAWDNFLISDSFSYGSKLIILSSTIVWFFTTFSYVANEKIGSFEYWIFVLLVITAILFIFQSYDLLIIYLSIELQSLIFYVLASFKRTSEFSTEAGLKYFILGAFSSALLLFGCSLVYGLTGLTNLGDYSKLFTGTSLNQSPVLLGSSVGLMFIVTSFLFKLSAAPFHMWSPDVYEGAPTSITALFSILPKLAILSVLLRFLLFSFHDFFYNWSNVIMISSLLSILVGTLGAFSQKKWKRFLAYSSINHIGFFLMGFATGGVEGIFSLVFYVIIYMVTMFGAFSFIISFRYYRYPKHYQTRYLTDLIGLAKINPFLALSFTIFLFSMAGIPPLSGFFAKVFILLSALQNNTYGLVIFAVLMSCISCFYYIRLIKNMYFETEKIRVVMEPISKLNSLTLSLLTFLIVFLFLDIELVSIFVMQMSLPFLG